MVVIAISGMSGCGSTTTSKLLSKKLGLKFFSVGEYFRKNSQNLNTTNVLKFFKSKKGSSKKLHNKLDELVIQKAKKGNIVCDGKLTIHFLKNIADFKIYLKASKKIRAQRYVKKDKIAFKKAIELVDEKDKTEKKNFTKIYNIKPFLLEKESDIIINSSNKNPEKVVKEIILFMNK